MNYEKKRRLMKKYISVMLVICLFALVITPTSVNAISMSAETAVLVDVESGRVLYSKNGNHQMKIASLTKIMTAIVAIESADLNSTVKTSKNAVGVEGSSIYLKLNEKMKLHDMLYGLMLRSGNDAATAIAEHISGSMEKFAELMNEKALEIGMEGTLFSNSHGLDWGEGNYSTANDMGKLLAYCLRNPIFKEIVSTKVMKVPWEGESYDRVFYNKNKMLSLYPGGDGVKTGYTVRAGRCLASSATKDEWQLATIVLNAPDMWRDSARLLDFGFQEYHRQQVIETEVPLQEIKVLNGQADSIHVVATKQIYYPIKEKEHNDFTYSWELPAEIKAPVKDKQYIGDAIVYFKEEKIARIPLYSDSNVNRLHWFERLRNFFR